MSDEIEVQTRSEANGMNYFKSLAEAFKHADEDESVWKVSFLMGEDSVRFVRRDGGWFYEPILPEDTDSSEPEKIINVTEIIDKVAQGRLLSAEEQAIYDDIDFDVLMFLLRSKALTTIC